MFSLSDETTHGVAKPRASRLTASPKGRNDMAEPRDRIRGEQLRHGVAPVARDLILSRKVKPGDILRLGPIAEELGISITPVREALLLLAQDGSRAQEPTRGSLVLPPRRSDVEDIYLMWAAAEGAQASRAAQLATPADIEALHKVAAEPPNPDSQTPQRAIELNGDVHATIHRIADAPKLQWFTDAARRLIPYEFWFEFYSVPGWQELNSTDHTAIIDAIEAHDADAAGEAMRQHYVDTSRLLLNWLGSINFWGAAEEPRSEPQLVDRRNA